ncbi:NAD(P)H-hydrate dehydratase [Xanthomonas arboricola pv. juglandis]|uniref:ADP-dependent (S)-NAD(P)H-hydrate dehydratase n=1 Tax=Xanthomonas campestris pv. juglandis TaxID=195709 RepID=A0A2N7V733_XANCJ|nr:NAD(P)H-hydrate dehydratase [Xanthomonas arboricola]AKU49284.1 ADP-dependent (S)-NAD(P)H-hydrate dehydratase [Xanthomonas arboricola pv. juglandis]KOA96208.1 ADP-dependent (S)-NAD(P)H-hydrate dehydratase [Xanthomonas arboricola]KOA97457.1 ADP-dependent (S)-NAD(P)H-hydrate dehydratase [Xanthomonas arboricola]KOB04235.1 ADP-dependent (S)-NAD(P)H-hydrate dehydratase [Xanthomonas arboricola]KOB05021.1 ADP-dependent (S)-NAD(P)H-hydrate dehydratase [Xanthomonas arboricola]
MAAPRMRMLTAAALRSMPLPAPGGDKEQRGRVLIVGGSMRVPGAVLLAGEAALRTGAGKLQIATAASVAPGMALAVPEALVLGLAQNGQGEIVRGHRALDGAMAACDAAVIGPGMASSATTTAMVRRAAEQAVCTLVLDAGALSRGLRAPIGRPFVLTPHAGEMATLAGDDKAAVEAAPGAYALKFAQKLRSVVIVKGADSFIAGPDGVVWMHRGGASGLGTSGSGDVLAGLIAGFAARGCDALTAALWGVFVHAAAGRQLARRIGPVGFLARELGLEVPGILDRLARR